VREGWRTEELGDLCSIELGKTPARANPAFWDRERETENIWLSIADLLDAEDNVAVDSKEYLSAAGAAISKTVPEGTLLVSFKLTLGRLAFAGRDLFTNEAIAALGIRDECQLSKHYLFHFLQFFDWDKATEGDVKLKGRTLNKAKLEKIGVNFPALPEQQRIVSVLDEAFGAIEAVIATAERNLQNAHTLFESQLEAILARQDDMWVENAAPLSGVCELIVDCEHRTAPTQEHGIPSIRTPNVGRGKLLLDGVYRVSTETYGEWTRRAVPLPGDLILAREAPAGNVAVIPDNLKVCLGQRTVLIRPRASIFEPEFLAWMLLQGRIQKKLLAHSRGATVQHVNMKDIRALELGPVPPISTQRDMVAAIRAALQHSERLESIYQRKLAALEALKQSLLHQAFTGQLGSEAA
jgi:type I restriction enzyme S subunit